MIVFTVFTIIMWSANHYKLYNSLLQMLAVYIVIISSLICFIWMLSIKKNYKYVFSILLIISAFIVGFFGKLP